MLLYCWQAGLYNQKLYARSYASGLNVLYVLGLWIWYRFSLSRYCHAQAHLQAWRYPVWSGRSIAQTDAADYVDILVNRLRMLFLLIQHFLEFIDLLFCDNPLWHVFLLLLLSSPYVRVLPYTYKIKEGISNALLPDFFLLFGIYIYFHPSCFTPRCSSNSNIAISVASLSRIFPVLIFVSASWQMRTLASSCSFVNDRACEIYSSRNTAGFRMSMQSGSPEFRYQVRTGSSEAAWSSVWSARESSSVPPVDTGDHRTDPSPSLSCVPRLHACTPACSKPSSTAACGCP